MSVAAPPQDRCILTADTADTAAPPATLAIAVPDVARFVERQVYETLIRLDCTGAVTPGLAQSWASDDGGRRWIFTLRPAARFSDSTPLTAVDVFAALTRDSLLLDRSGIAVEGHDQVSVRFDASAAGVPPVFADTALVVTRRAASRAWLLGTGVATADTESGSAKVTPLAASGRPTVMVRSDSGVDARDLIDHGIDILVTGAPEVLSYAARRGDLVTVPLPWDRVFVLVSPEPVNVGDTARASLARDVVRSDARPARENYWWLAGPACPAGDSTTARAPASAPSSASVVYYSQGDADARGLAERLVALGSIGTGGRALALAPADFDIRFSGGGASYLLALPRSALAPCQAVAQLAARAPWLTSNPGRYITGLVETRQHAIVRRGGSAFTVDWDGTLRLR